MKRELIINMVNNCTDQNLANVETSWEDLLKLFHAPHSKGSLSLSDYLVADDKTRKAEKDGLAWIPCSIKDPLGRRLQENMDLAYLMVLDIDDGLPLEIIHSVLSKYEYALHSSYSHSPSKPKWRVVLPLAQPIPASELPSLFDHMNGLFDGKLDASCGHDPARLYYLPACPADAEDQYVFKHHEGVFLDPDKFIIGHDESSMPSMAPTEPVKPPGTAKFDVSSEGTPLSLCKATSAKVPEGERNTTLTSKAGRLFYEGLHSHEVLKQLLEFNITKCEPPLPEDEVVAIVESIARYPVPAEHTIKTLNDVGNGQRFVESYGNVVRYIHESGHWLMWKDSFWQHDKMSIIMEFAKHTASLIYNEAAVASEKEVRTKLAKHAEQSLNLPRLKAMIESAQSDRSVSISAGDLDHDGMLLGVQNGVVDLRTGEFRGARRADLITKKCATQFDSTACCPLFEGFLSRVMGSDKDMVAFLQRVAGYLLTGKTIEHKFAFIHGTGANGKSTFLEILLKLLGDYAAQAQPETFMLKRSGGGIRNDIARLVGKRLVVSNEVQDGAHLDENLVKQLVGGDTVTARFLFKEHFEFRPQFKLMIAGNHLPVVKGDDHGIWRRVLFVPFLESIPESERDKHLGSKLEAELSGILNWAIIGCLAWQRDGLNPPERVLDATKQYRVDMDLLAHWLEEECEVASGKQVSSKRLYESYKRWCDMGSIKPLSQLAFHRKMEARGFHKTHTRSCNMFEGLALKESFSELLFSAA